MEWPPSKSRTAWWVLGLFVVVLLAWVFTNYAGAFVLGLFLYYVTRPAHWRLQSRFRPTIAAVISLLVLAVPVVLLVGYTLAVAAQELGNLAQTVDLGPLAGFIEPYLDVSTIVQDPEVLLENPDVVSAGQLFATGVLAYLPLIGAALIDLFLALTVAYYLLRDGPRLSRWLRNTLGGNSAVFDEYVELVDEDLGSVFFGNILNAFVVAIVAVVLYSTLDAVAPAGGIPYPALVGVLAGAASLIPVVGMKLVYVPVALGLFGRAFLNGEPLWFPTAFLAATVVIVDFIPDLLLRPYVSGRNLHVGLVMIAYIIGPTLFGWYGLFLGPLLLVVVYHFARVIVPTLTGNEGTERTPTPPADAVGIRAAEPSTRDGGSTESDAT
ncbi:AI-2E family transporter [Haloarcula nitratireducens]|uniref:AI-2E family transporter n=1 Tax=Haloarcula nitratireducens TaxID=2487749 RepID=A0AAW4P8R9_9EURY|nr:AI-2E family transporter [Halomicroarcula nitratireducens]MBX0294315.1 AI-2E family transporter [Halomicroarcula nitratireducens]